MTDTGDSIGTFMAGAIAVAMVAWFLLLLPIGLLGIGGAVLWLMLLLPMLAVGAIVGALLFRRSKGRAASPSAVDAP